MRDQEFEKPLPLTPVKIYERWESRKGGEERERDKNKKTWENIGCIHERYIYIYIGHYVLYSPDILVENESTNIEPQVFLFFWMGVWKRLVGRSRFGGGAQFLGLDSGNSSTD